jgi:hypothetical protein
MNLSEEQVSIRPDEESASSLNDHEPITTIGNQVVGDEDAVYDLDDAIFESTRTVPNDFVSATMKMKNKTKTKK